MNETILSNWEPYHHGARESREENGADTVFTAYVPIQPGLGGASEDGFVSS